MANIHTTRSHVHKCKSHYDDHDWKTHTHKPLLATGEWTDYDSRINGIIANLDVLNWFVRAFLDSADSEILDSNHKKKTTLIHIYIYTHYIYMLTTNHCYFLFVCC